MKKRLKVFFTYLGVALISLLMTVVVCAAFLFFYRDGNIFGIQYIKRNEILYARSQDVGIIDVKGVSVACDDFDVKVDINPYAENISGAMVNKVFGYVHKSKAHASISAKYDESTGVVVFTVVEPQGWISKKDCYIAIGIPEILVDKNIDVDVKSVKGDIVVGGKKSIVINDINVESSKGEVTLTNLDIRHSISANIGSGWMFVDEKCVTTAGDVDVNIKLGSGIVNFTKVGNFDIGCVKIEKIKSGEIGILKAVEVVTDGKISGGGKIQVGEALEVTILTLDTDIKIGTIGAIGSEDALTSRVDISGNGYVEILRVYSNLEITGHNGDINIGNAIGSVSLSTNQGDIQISKAYKNVSIETQYGNARIQFGEEAPQYSKIGGGRSLIASTKNGHVIASGVQNANVMIREKGRATLNYDLVRGENSVIAYQIGVIDIVVPYKPDNGNIAINLQTKSETLPDVKVGTVSSGQAVINDGVYTLDVKNIYGNAGENTLYVETVTGNIKIRSRDLVNF